MGGVAAGVGYVRRKLQARLERQREQVRAWQDLEHRLEEITRQERAGYAEVDNELLERGVYRSGMRSAEYLEVAESHDRMREQAVRQWRRRLENARIRGLPAPPSNGATRPSRFEENGVTFERQWLHGDPAFCWCGRLAYAAGDGRGFSWWCPEHEYDVS